MDIVSIGGGPAGLYCAILMKKLDSNHRIRVLERNRPDDTFGWGVVFSDETLGAFESAMFCASYHPGKNAPLNVLDLPFLPVKDFAAQRAMASILSNGSSSAMNWASRFVFMLTAAPFWPGVRCR